MSERSNPNDTLDESKTSSFILREPLVITQTPQDEEAHSQPQDPSESYTSGYATSNGPIPLSIDRDLPEDPDEIIKEHHWKDRLNKCCIHGICHPSYVYGCCFSIFGLAQVMFRILSTQRNKLIVFWFITTFFIGHFLLEYILYLNITKHCTPDVISFFQHGADRDQVFLDTSCKHWVELYGRFSYIYFAITAVSVAIVRHMVRKKYHIAPSCRPKTQDHKVLSCEDGWTEDCCFSIFCASCVTAQLMRHTGNYESFRASFCNYTGLTHVPGKRQRTTNDRIDTEETEETNISCGDGIC